MNLIMPHNSETKLPVVKGLIVKDSTLAPVLVFLVIILGATPAGALAVHAWWAGKLFFGMKLAWYGALIGLVGVISGLFSIGGLINTFRQKNLLVIGEECFQKLQYGKVIVQIPFANIARLEYGEHSLLGKFIDFKFIDAADPRTICLDSLSKLDRDCDFQIADAGWRMPMEALHKELESRLPGRALPGRGRLAKLRSEDFQSMPSR
jgi:hypothetical protein